MTTYSRLISVSSALFALLTASLAGAQENPCGKFDFSTGIDCRIEVKGGCEAQCQPLNFEAACSGQCVADVSVTCTGSCEAQCNAQCNPAMLDCNAGCQAECDTSCHAECGKITGADCDAECSQRCDADCSASCTGTAANCQANCQECCHGSCTASANIGCHIDCHAELTGGCQVQCQEPEGALFCNGQYVSAADVNACIVYLEENYEAKVNVEARGQVTCDLSGCEGTGTSTVGWCSVSDVGKVAGGTGAVSAAALALGAALGRRRRRDAKK